MSPVHSRSTLYGRSSASIRSSASFLRASSLAAESSGFTKLTISTLLNSCTRTIPRVSACFPASLLNDGRYAA